MARYDERPVPRGTSRRWEVLMRDDDGDDRPPPARQTALEVRREHRVLRELPEDLLRGIVLVEPGARLEPRGEYLDLHDPARADFRAEGGAAVRPGQRLVARADVSDAAWQALRAACDRVVGRQPLRRGTYATERPPGLPSGPSRSPVVS